MLIRSSVLYAAALCGALVITAGCQAQPEPTAVVEDPSRTQPCAVGAPASGSNRVARTPSRRVAATPCVDLEDHEAAMAHIDGLIEEIEAEGGE
ncbi:MAG: hypothetical protein IPG45_06525 [Deltaproteobacteria bacterium]|jgi:hypothetical protein|nr:hypothetical protein [Deltaproteobacteria bacterium]